MSRPTFAVIASFALVCLAHGASTLDWASTTAWSGGASTGSYNSGSGAGTGTSVITPLTYNFGGGLTATVSAVRTGSATWQDGTPVYGVWAPGVAISSNPNRNGLFAFGIANGSANSGASIVLTFNQAVSLDTFTLGDIDSGNVQDLVSVQSDTGALSVLGSATTAPAAVIAGNLISFTGVTGDANFQTNVSSGWSTISSGSTMFTSLTISLLNGSGSHGIWLNDISVSAIPEPSTYALVLGGFTLALIAVRRRFVRRA